MEFFLGQDKLLVDVGISKKEEQNGNGNVIVFDTHTQCGQSGEELKRLLGVFRLSEMTYETTN